MNEPIFDLQHVSLVVPNRTLLDDVNLHVALGSNVTIGGPSGAGKSTLLRVLATLLTPTGGAVSYAGRKQQDYDKIAYRRQVSYCFQQPTLFGNTVRDNLTFPFTIRNEPVDAKQISQHLEAMRLAAAMVDKPIVELSGGERQRVALIRNLLFKPAVLLLDEVTAGLDADTKATVHRVLADYNAGGGTLIAVTHDESELAAAQRLVTVTAGRVEVGA